MARFAIAYFVLLELGKSLNPHYVHHRNRPIVVEALCWARNAARKLLFSRRNAALTRTLTTRHAGRYFVLALQVHDDLQLLHHGRGWTIRGVIEEVIRSFAAGAPADLSLVIKVHPLARGHFPFHRLTRQCARRNRISDRVVVLDDAPLGELVRHCRGVVTVNSTSGLSALHHGRPVLILGHSFYEIPGLVTRADNPSQINAFWAAPTPPDQELWLRFRSHLFEAALVKGSFYEAQHVRSTMQGIIARLEREMSGPRSGRNPASCPSPRMPTVVA